MKLFSFFESAGKFVIGLLLLLQAFGVLQPGFGHWLLVLSALFLLTTGGLGLYKMVKTEEKIEKNQESHDEYSQLDF